MQNNFVLIIIIIITSSSIIAFLIPIYYSIKFIIRKKISQRYVSITYR